MRLTTKNCLRGVLLTLFAGLLPACASVSPWGTAGQFHFAGEEKRLLTRPPLQAEKMEDDRQH